MFFAFVRTQTCGGHNFITTAHESWFRDIDISGTAIGRHIFAETA